ncbi:hypothetical protein [Rubritalea tangerina]|uniref:hypothetical protein n=1 Tax=Rubritalea tangerina TaxID=430798 RepID=UPI00361E2CAA
MRQNALHGRSIGKSTPLSTAPLAKNSTTAKLRVDELSCPSRISSTCSRSPHGQPPWRLRKGYR